MSDHTARRRVLITNEQGLHFRPAGLIVDTATKFQSQIWIVKESQPGESSLDSGGGSRRVDAKSITDVLTLYALKGTELILEAQGLDADQAVEALERLIREKFSE